MFISVNCQPVLVVCCLVMHEVIFEVVVFNLFVKMSVVMTAELKKDKKIYYSMQLNNVFYI